MSAAGGGVPPLVVIAGPTGGGKSELALELADRLEDSLPVELVSVDSALVYRGMDIGTAKPSAAARARLPHHLIDIRDPAQRYSAGEFVSDALAAISAIQGRGRLPLLVGGTMLYHRALRQGLAPLPPACAALRAALDAQARQYGWPYLHRELGGIDPAAAARIAPTDAQRIQRAIEVYRLTGVPISRWHATTAARTAQFQWRRYALLPNSRDELRARLAARLQSMLAAGFLEEVRRLYERGDLTTAHPALRAVGYRQLWEVFASGMRVAEAERQALQATVQLAKRQLTWLRSETDLIPLNMHTAVCVGQVQALAEEIRSAVAHDRLGGGC